MYIIMSSIEDLKKINISIKEINDQIHKKNKRNTEHANHLKKLFNQTVTSYHILIKNSSPTDLREYR